MAEDRAIKYSFVGSPTLEDFYHDWTHRTLGLMGPFGSGKSSAAVMKLIAAGLRQKAGPDGWRRTRFAVIRNTYLQLRDTTIKTVLDWLPEVHFGTYQSTPRPEYHITNLAPKTDIHLVFRALDRPEHIANLLSLELTGAWVNEAREVPWEIIRVLGRRLDRFPARRDGGATWAGVILDTNPPDTETDWFRFFEEDCPPTAKLYKQPGGLDPKAENRANLPPDYYTTMADDLSEDELRVYRDGEYGFLRTGKPVYPEYRDAVHCAEVDVLEGVRIHRCWDFGLTPACVFIQMDPAGRIRIIDELCADRAGILQHGERVVRYCAERYPTHHQRNMFEDVGDPAGDVPGQTDEKSCFDIMRGLGLDPELGVQDVTLRLESVKYVLRTLIDGIPGLLVHPRAKMVRRGFQGGYEYRRMVVSGNRFAEKPNKNAYSHPHDALQYGCVKLVGHLVEGLNRLSGGNQREAVSRDPFDRPAHEAYSADHLDPFDRMDWSDEVEPAQHFAE